MRKAYLLAPTRWHSFKEGTRSVPSYNSVWDSQIPLDMLSATFGHVVLQIIQSCTIINPWTVPKSLLAVSTVCRVIILGGCTKVQLELHALLTWTRKWSSRATPCRLQKSRQETTKARMTASRGYSPLDIVQWLYIATCSSNRNWVQDNSQSAHWLWAGYWMI